MVGYLRAVGAPPKMFGSPCLMSGRDGMGARADHRNPLRRAAPVTRYVAANDYRRTRTHTNTASPNTITHTTMRILFSFLNHPWSAWRLEFQPPARPGAAPLPCLRDRREAESLGFLLEALKKRQACHAGLYHFQCNRPAGLILLGLVYYPHAAFTD